MLKDFATIPGIIHTEAGRANGRSSKLDGPYDGYAECVKIHSSAIDANNGDTHVRDDLFENHLSAVNQQGKS